jgi:limonene-1,2-epoxide hydrolase
MAIDPEVTVRAFLAEMEGREWDAARIERLVGYMSPDARYHVVAWHEPLFGRDAIREEMARQGAAVRDVRIDIPAIASVGRTVLTERLDSMTLRGKHGTFHVAGVFEVDADGRITRWSDYTDSREVAVKMRPDSSDS